MNKSILLIIPEFGYGGAEKSFSALSVMLEQYYDVQIVVFNTKRKPIYPLGGTLNSLNVFGSNNWFLKFVGFWKRVIRLRDLKMKFRPSASISFLEGADYVNLLSKRSEKVILSIRGSKFHDENIRGIIGWMRINLLMPILYKKADHVVVVNDGIKQEIAKFISPERITTITNVWNIDRIREASEITLDASLEKLISPNYIVAVGRLSNEKGFHHLIRVFASLKNRLSDYQLVIVGDGDMGEELLQICDNYNLTHSNIGGETKEVPDVLFTGYLKNPFNIMSRAKLYVLTSSAEGYPNTMIEAMSLGVPVMSTNCPYGPSEILSVQNTKSNTSSTPFDSDFGILAPMFDRIENYAIWVELIRGLVKDEKKLKRYRTLALERAYELKSDDPSRSWITLIDK